MKRLYPILTALAVATTPVAVAQAAPSPSALSRDELVEFTRIYDAIDSRQWDEATRLIDAAPQSPMASMARAELFLAAGSPVVPMGALLALLEDAPWLPHAEQLGRLAQKRGAQLLPDLPQVQRFSWLGTAPQRGKPQSVGDAAAAAIAAQVQERIKNDDPAGAEALVEAASPAMSEQARTEWRQRVAWSYYIENDDASALRLADLARTGSGEWATQAQWVYALASWRAQHFAQAEAAFDSVAATASNDEMRAAAYYWGARASMAAGRPQMVQAKYQTAAQFHETLYGILAAEALGIEPLARKQAITARNDWSAIQSAPNVKIAIGLAQIGRTALADGVLKHQAKIAGAEQYRNLASLARALGLPETQLYLAHYGPSGARPDSFARYPNAAWSPQGGWRVDQNLVFAHALQESRFQPAAQSPAGARGLMQVMPATARGMAARRGGTVSETDLSNPSVNLEYGQSYLEMLRDMSQTEGLLPKVIAAYNAGPAPIGRWKTEVRDLGDPLLFIESIPYAETRGYVANVLRNYWMYEQQQKPESASRLGLAQNMWPRFPGLAGPASVRINDPYKEDRLASR